MSRNILVFVIVITLISCSPAQSSQLPTVTPVPTSTLTPIPIVTQSASPTPEAWVAMTIEYGLPEKMARQLEGVDVSFEIITENVDGILITNHETGEDLLYFDLNTEVWVDVDRFEGTSDIENISFTITEEELRSKEMTAWLYYKASKLEFDWEDVNPGKMKLNLSAGNIRLFFDNDTESPDFESNNLPPFERNPGSLMYIDTPDLGHATDFVFTPIIYFDKNTKKLSVVKGFLRGNAEKPGVFLRWQNEMSTSLIVREIREDYPYPSPIVTETERLFKQDDMTLAERLTAFSGGDLSALSDSNIVVEMSTG